MNNTQTEYELRPEFEYIVDMVKPGKRVLDLGCGEGYLMKALQEKKRARVQGIELSDTAIQECVAKGLFVYQGDLDEGLADFNDDSFDYVILTNTIQVLHRPDIIIKEAARVGKQAIISIPNFAYWRIRLHLLLRGTMPKTTLLPYEWYDSPNLHPITISDFSRFCKEHGLEIIKETDLVIRDGLYKQVNRLFSNISADYAIFLLQKS